MPGHVQCCHDDGPCMPLYVFGVYVCNVWNAPAPLPANTAHTHASLFLCTPARYRAPELLYGAREYGGGVDVWAVGAILAEMLGGLCAAC